MKKNVEKNKVTDRTKGIIILVTVLVVIVSFSLWMLSRAGAKPSEKLVLTVGEEEVYLDEVYFGILQGVSALGVTSESMENAVTDDGMSMEEYYKQVVLKSIMDYKVEYMVAKEQGLTLTEEEEKKIRKDVVEYLGSIDARILNKWGIKQELIEEVYKQQYYAYKLEEMVAASIEVEEQRFCTIYMMMFPKIEMSEDGDYVRQEDGETPIMLSDEEIQLVKENAEKALQELESGADEDEIAKKYGVELFSGEDSNLVESFEEPFLQYVAILKENECSPVIETEAFYAIVKIISENNEEYAEQILGYYRADQEAAEIATQKRNWYQQMGISEKPDLKGHTWEHISLYDFVQ